MIAGHWLMARCDRGEEARVGSWLAGKSVDAFVPAIQARPGRRLRRYGRNPRRVPVCLFPGYLFVRRRASADWPSDAPPAFVDFVGLPGTGALPVRAGDVDLLRAWLDREGTRPSAEIGALIRVADRLADEIPAGLAGRKGAVYLPFFDAREIRLDLAELIRRISAAMATGH